MTNTKPYWTQEQLQDFSAKASGMYLTLTGLTETPREAAEIIMMMHLLLFLNCGDGTGCDVMLTDYVKNFKVNWENQVAHAKEGLH